MHKLSIAILLTLLVLTFCYFCLSSDSSWVIVSSRVSRSVVLFDLDGDGLPERLYLDGYVIIEPGLELRTDGVPVKAGTLGSTLCLYVYRASVGLLSGICGPHYAELPVPVGEIPRAYSTGLVIGDIVVVGLRAYYSPPARRGVVLEFSGKPVVLGVEDGRLVLHYLETSVREVIADLDVTVQAAIYDETGRAIYATAVRGRTPLIIRYNVSTGFFSYEPLPFVSIRQAFSTKRSIYVLTGDGVLYRFTPYSASWEPVVTGVKVFYPADNLDSFTLLSTAELVKIEELYNRVAMKRCPLPALREVYAADWWGPIVALASDTGVYVLSLEPVTVTINAPSSVYAGEDFTVYVSGVYSRVYLYIGNVSTVSTKDLAISVNLPAGTYTVRAVACRGVYCIQRDTLVSVERRPVRLKIVHPESAEPYERVIVLLETIDAISGEPVRLLCSIKDLDGRVNTSVEPGKPVEIPVVPFHVDALFTVECLGNEYYEDTTAVFAIHLTKPYLDVRVFMEKPGLLLITAYDVYTGDQWPWLVVAEVDGVVSTGRGLTEVSLKPGRNLIHVVLARNGVLILEKNLEVYYYYEYLYETTTATLVKPHIITVTVHEEAGVLEPLAIVAVALLSSGATYAVVNLIRARATKHE